MPGVSTWRRWAVQGQWAALVAVGPRRPSRRRPRRLHPRRLGRRALDSPTRRARRRRRLAEAYLRSVSLDVEAGRGSAEALDHIAAIRPFWERDGAMVLYCTTAAIDLYGDRGELEAARDFHDEAIETLHRLWPGSIMWLRLRLSAVLVGQIASHVSTLSRSERAEWAALGERHGEGSREFVASRRLEGASRVEARAWFVRGEAETLRLRWLADVDPPSSEQLVEAWRASVAAFEEMGHSFEIARSRTRLAAALHAAGTPTEARTLVTPPGRRPAGSRPSRCLAELRAVAGPGRGREEHAPGPRSP